MMHDFTSLGGFKVASTAAFDEAQITHSDVDHLMIYDAFAHLPIYALEDTGFVSAARPAPSSPRATRRPAASCR